MRPGVLLSVIASAALATVSLPAEIVLDEGVGSGPVRDRKPEIYGDLLGE